MQGVEILRGGVEPGVEVPVIEDDRHPVVNG